MQDSTQFCSVYLKLWFISFTPMPVETSLWRHNHQHATSRDASKGIIVVKHFSCVISLELKIFARCKKHVSYFSSVYLNLIEIYLYTKSLASKLLNCDRYFVIFDLLTNVQIDFHMSNRQKRPVKFNWSFETPLFILYKTSCLLVLCMDLYWRIISNCNTPTFSD